MRHVESHLDLARCRCTCPDSEPPTGIEKSVSATATRMPGAVTVNPSPIPGWKRLAVRDPSPRFSTPRLGPADTEMKAVFHEMRAPKRFPIPGSRENCIEARATSPICSATSTLPPKRGRASGKSPSSSMAKLDAVTEPENSMAAADRAAKRRAKANRGSAARFINTPPSR
jgi:hypothetical protein